MPQLSIVKSEPLAAPPVAGERPMLSIVKSEPLTTQRPEQPSSRGGLVGAAVGKGVPVAGQMLGTFAKNKNVPKAAATVGRVLGGITPPIVGAMTHGPVGFALGLGAAAGGAWSGSKSGWFTGKLMQNLAAPVAKMTGTAAKYVPTVLSLSGAQTVLDLAQMADPDRKDIGVLGVGANTAEENQALRDKGIPPGPTLTETLTAINRHLPATIVEKLGTRLGEQLATIYQHMLKPKATLKPWQALAMDTVDATLQDGKSPTPMQVAMIKKIFAELPKR